MRFRNVAQLLVYRQLRRALLWCTSLTLGQAVAQMRNTILCSDITPRLSRHLTSHRVFLVRSNVTISLNEKQNGGTPRCMGDTPEVYGGHREP